jgi:hypothetical protein
LREVGSLPDCEDAHFSGVVLVGELLHLTDEHGRSIAERELELRRGADGSRRRGWTAERPKEREKEARDSSHSGAVGIPIGDLKHNESGAEAAGRRIRPGDEPRSRVLLTA